MDNLTHSLVGLAAAKAGLERLSPWATTVCVLAANAPDLDILATLGGKWFYLKHHRGITHSIIGTLALALLLPSLFYATGWLIAHLRKRPLRLRFKGLLLASLILSASHPLMDWTNNYGLRPLLPWSGRWFYGDLVFVVDPWLWLLVGGAVFLLTSQRTWQLISWSTLAAVLTTLVLVLPLQNTGLSWPNLFRLLWVSALLGLWLARRANLSARWGRSVAQIALLLVVAYWGMMALAHHYALAETETIARRIAVERDEKLLRFVSMPVLADPLRWQCVAETDRATYRYYVSLAGGLDSSITGATRFEKPAGADVLALERARKDERAQIFLDFARFPVVGFEGDCLSGLLVQFADLRYTEPSANGRGTFSLNVPVACDAEKEKGAGE